MPCQGHPIQEGITLSITNLSNEITKLLSGLVSLAYFYGEYSKLARVARRSTIKERLGLLERNVYRPDALLLSL